MMVKERHIRRKYEGKSFITLERKAKKKNRHVEKNFSLDWVRCFHRFGGLVFVKEETGGLTARGGAEGGEI